MVLSNIAEEDVTCNNELQICHIVTFKGQSRLLKNPIFKAPELQPCGPRLMLGIYICFVTLARSLRHEIVCYASEKALRLYPKLHLKRITTNVLVLSRTITRNIRRQAFHKYLHRRLVLLHIVSLAPLVLQTLLLVNILLPCVGPIL